MSAPQHIRPVRDMILVRRLPREVMAGSLVLPERSRTKQFEGEVLACGPGFHGIHGLILTDCQPGNRVLLSELGGTDLAKTDGEEHVLIRDQEVLGIFQHDGSLRLLLDRLLLKREESASYSRGGIIIPDAHRIPAVFCRVVATGPGRRFENGSTQPTDCQPGDRVLLQEWTGEIVVRGEPLTIASEAEIYGIVGD